LLIFVGFSLFIRFINKKQQTINKKQENKKDHQKD